MVRLPQDRRGVVAQLGETAFLDTGEVILMIVKQIAIVALLLFDIDVFRQHFL